MNTNNAYPLTFVNKLNNYIYAENLDPFDEKINIISNVTNKLIQDNVPFIYSPSKIKYNYELKNNKIIYDSYLKNFYNDMLRYYNDSIYLELIKIHNQDTNYVNAIKKYIDTQKLLLNNYK